MASKKKAPPSVEESMLEALKQAEMCMEYMIIRLLDGNPIKLEKVIKVKDKLTAFIDEASSDG